MQLVGLHFAHRVARKGLNEDHVRVHPVRRRRATPAGFRVVTAIAARAEALQAAGALADRRHMGGAPRWVGCAVTWLALVAMPAIAQAAPYPANDDFVRQDVLVTNWSGLPDSATLGPATSELGEPLHGAAGPTRSTWWSWTAPRSGLAEAESCSSRFTPLLGVYTGFDVAQLIAVPGTAVGQRCQITGTPRFGVALRFQAVEGTTYRIATATDGSVDGLASANVQLAPVGDDFADAPAFPGGWSHQEIALGLAGAQSGEPDHGGRATTHSAWFAYSSARRERVRIDACRANYSPVSSTVTIYRGATLASLTEVASSRDAPSCGNGGLGGQVEALLDAGVDYRVAVTQDDPTSEPVTLSTDRSPRDDSALTPSKLAGRTVDLGLATREIGEPAHAGQAGGRSRWQVLEPEDSATYELSTCPGPYDDDPVPDSLLAVYEGAAGTAVDALTPVASNDDGCSSGMGSLLRFRALAGHRYLVAIDSKGGVAATVGLRIARSPQWDDRDRALSVDYQNSSTSTSLATAEPGEPDHAGQPAVHSLWYRWVAPRGGTARVLLCRPSFDAVLAVYGIDESQPAIGSATATPGCVDPITGKVGSGPRLEVPVTGGRTYLIAIDGAGGASGQTGSLRISMTTPVNDDFADATSLADGNEPDGASFASSSAATAQAGEPAHAGRAAERSSWWRWTATRTGFVTLSSCATTPEPSDDTTLAVYTGDSLTDLRPMGAADGGCQAQGGAGNALLSFYAVRGTIYRIAADAHGTSRGASVRMSLPPSNDRFSRAYDVSSQGFGYANLSAATREPGEPDHAGRVGGRSLWYAWTPRRTHLVEMHVCAYIDTLLAVYSGTAVDALTEVASSDDASPGVCEYTPGSKIRFLARVGTTYKIAVDGKDGAFGQATLSIRGPGPADQFATAEDLGARPESTEADLRLNGAEAGEPAHGGRAAVRSSWLRFTPEKTYIADLRSCSATADTVLAMYGGESLATLTQVAADDDGGGCSGDAAGAHIRFRALPGVTYSVAVDASTAARVEVAIELLPANDDLVDAATLSPAPGAVLNETLSGATREAGEPDHGAGATAVSAWYRVRVGSARTVQLAACPSSPGRGSAAVLAVYTGGSITALAPVEGAVSSPCSNGTAGGRIAFPAQPGSDVLVAVAAPASTAREYALTVEQVPPNDLFAASEVIEDRGGGGTVGEAAGAGTEPGEPRHAGRSGGHSIWWSYTPSTDRRVKVHACASGGPLLAVYTGGAVDALTPVAIGIQEDSPFHCANLDFAVRAGVTYRLALDVDGGGPGRMSLALTPQLPDHTSFAAAEPVDIPSSRLDDLEGAGPELGEPAHAGLGGSRSVWYRLGAVDDELLDISSCGYNGTDTVVAVYTGDTVDALTEVASNDEDSGGVCSFGSRDAHVAVPVRAGAVYWIAVDEAISSSGRGFQLRVSRRAPHDAFADPFELTPADPVVAWTGTASAEPGEPSHDGARPARSVWTAWTADRSGPAVVQACGSEDVALRLAAYTGERVDALTPVASNDDSPACPGTFPAGARLDLDVVAGERYHVAVDEPYEYSAAQVTLHVAPDNDDRAAAAPLPAPGEGADVDLTAAGLQAGEPRHAGVRGGGSAWYRVTPAVTGGLQVSTCATEPFDTVLTVYEPGVGGVLTQVAVADDAADCGARDTGARLRWGVQAGRTYLVAVASATSKRGPARLEVEQIAAPMPQTRLTGEVARRTSETTVSVAFDSDTPGASFECRADREEIWAACVSPVVRTGLAEGEHSLAVRAVAGGVADAEPAIAAFSVDRTAPEPALSGPAAGAVVRPGEVYYGGTCSQRPGDAVRYTLRIWSGETTAGTPQVSRTEPCDPYFDWYTRLTEGRYTIVVEQADDVGNVGSTAPRVFTVRFETPIVRLQAPSTGSALSLRRPTFSGRVSGAGSGPVTVHVREQGAAPSAADVLTLTAAVDESGGPYVAHPFSVTSAADLPEGGYEARAERSSGAGVVGSSGAINFVVDVTAPAVTVTSPADGASTNADPVVVSGTGESGGEIALTAAGPGGTSRERTAAVTSSTWRVSLPGLEQGDHVITVRQTDAAGNVGTSASRTIHVDRNPPGPDPAPAPAPTPVPAAPAVPTSPPPAPAAPPRATAPAPARSTFPAPAIPSSSGTSPTPFITAHKAKSLTDRLLPGRGAVRLKTNDTLGNWFFVAPRSRVRMRRASTQLVGVAVCSLKCTVKVKAAVKLEGKRGRSLRTRQLTVRAGPRGRVLRIRVTSAQRRRIQRARGATATVTIRWVDSEKATHRVRRKLRLLSR